jgi:hypothetical protein
VLALRRETQTAAAQPCGQVTFSLVAGNAHQEANFSAQQPRVKI